MAMKRTYGEGGLELDANTVNGPTMRLLDAHASAMLPGEGPVPLVMASIGLLKVPFGFEVGQANRGRLFLERSTAAQAFFPDAGEGYDLGARIQGGWRFLRYAVVVQNGELLGSGRFAGLDPNYQKDIAGRAGIDTEIVEGIHVSGGVSLLRGTGFHQGTPATKGTVARDVDELLALCGGRGSAIFAERSGPGKGHRLRRGLFGQRSRPRNSASGPAVHAQGRAGAQLP
jgi:hypothetical protein